ncbi:MAG: acyltransferase [Dehalococcoidales bacterium]|nr:acyltransferase [Dehalococcoidales bacterium]
MNYYSYHGVTGNIKYYIRFMFSRLFQMLALFAPHPSMIVTFNKMRGMNIGKHVYIGQFVHMDSRYPHLITLEDNVSIGTNSMIFAHSDPGYSVFIEENYYPSKVAPTVIKKGAWVAPASIIMCGITIGENSIVGAASVVTHDVDPYTVVAGNPARQIKTVPKSL